MSGQAPWEVSASPTPPLPAAPSRGVNGLGIAGFVIGMVSLCVVGGILAPIGLLLSLIGLFREPRGWAVAGTGVNLVALCCCMPWGLPLILMTLGLATPSGVALWITDTFARWLGPRGVTAIHVSAFVMVVMMYFAEHQRVPESLADLDMDPRVLADGWGNPFMYEVTDDPEGFRFWSVGQDRAAGTGDDLEFEGVVRGGTLDFSERGRTRSAAPANRGGASGDAASPDRSAPPDGQGPSGSESPTR